MLKNKEGWQNATLYLVQMPQMRLIVILSFFRTLRFRIIPWEREKILPFLHFTMDRSDIDP